MEWLTPTSTPSALVLATDGVPNSYETSEGYFKFCRDIVGYTGDPVGLHGNLRQWLPEISRKQRRRHVRRSELGRDGR